MLKSYETHFRSNGYNIPDMWTWSVSYYHGYRKPRYPVPAIPLEVHWPSDGYLGCVYIDAVNYGTDNPIMVRAWDFWIGRSRMYYWADGTNSSVYVEDF